ncbi:hydroxyacylglutathione hydrolase [Nematocida sp. AWRm80]|nr:hydroxyacylglutathione hydrolase [Nematocida sp. AWRm80]
MLIHPIRARETNNMYVIVSSDHKVVLVDPYNPEEVQKQLQEHNYSTEPVISITTHCHKDHSGGNPFLEKTFPGIKIFAGSDRVHCTNICKDNETISVGNLTIKCLHTPGHTKDSVSYYVTDSEDPEQKAVFVGDLIFFLGCGKFFEGTPEDIRKAMERIIALPSDTVIYYGHDYQEDNLRFRNQFVPEPTDLLNKRFLTVKEESEYNPFINTALLDNVAEFKDLSPIERLGKLRELKDQEPLPQTK